MDKQKKAGQGISRRDFLGSAAGMALFTIVPSHVLGADGQTPPSRKLNVAGVGVGGMGGGNIAEIAKTENIVALCDVDFSYAAGTFKNHPKARQFKDYRKMLDEMGKDIDAVVIATPDHTHAVVAMECMKRGKHVYVQKPLTKTVYEARMMAEAARKYNVITQMGNQGHSGEGIRLVCEWIWDGAIGEIREVHAWTNRPIWPQAISRPQETPAIPETLDWDLWIGPSPMRPYHPAYLPFKWRGWRDFGTGALGDMACHILDPVFWSLKLKYATSVQGSCVKQDDNTLETYPLGSVIHLEYPSRGDLPPVTIHWYDGGLMPERPAELEADRKMGDGDGGVLFVGDKGKLMCGCYGRGPQLIPYTKMKEYKRPAKTLPRVETSHEMNWVEACKSGKQASTPFDYAGPFTEMVLMGNLSLFKPNEKILWDGDKMQVTNFPELTQFINPAYREGWSL
ncbi:MAG: Gfo/Idh/MocA family oxidoreductase [Anaerohalosphaeraceae bacterium]